MQGQGAPHVRVQGTADPTRETLEVMPREELDRRLAPYVRHARVPDSQRRAEGVLALQSATAGMIVKQSYFSGFDVVGENVANHCVSKVYG